MNSNTLVMPSDRHALHIVHGYNEPFLSLSNQYSRALQNDGWRVTTVYVSGREDDAIRAATIADQVIFFDTPDKAMKGLKLGLLLRVRQLIAQQRFSLIIGQRYKPLYLSLLASIGMSIPVLGVAHAFSVLQSASRRRLLHRFRHRLTLVGVSDAVASDMRANEKILRILTLHNCIDTVALESILLPRDVARQQLQLAANEFIFANVGRLHDDKDQATIIRAFALVADKLPHAKLLLIGKGKREARYRALIEELHLQGRAILTGPLANAATLFPAFDAYISASDREPFGIVLAEAMLARLPVISTDCGGAPEVLGDYAHYFSRGDSVALAKAMAKLASFSVDDRTQQGHQLYERLQAQFSFAAFQQRLLALVQTMVKLT